MRGASILTSYIEGDIRDTFLERADDFIVCADGGFTHAVKLGLTPDLCLGDFDSLGYTPTQCKELLTAPEEKDDTDTMLAVKEAIKRGYSDIRIFGGIGGRLDHTIANIQTMHHALEQGADVQLIDGYNRAFFLPPKKCISLKANGMKTLSLFSWSEICTGITLTGAWYSLDNGTLEKKFPLGVSNRIEGESTLSYESGLLLVIMSRDR